MTDEREYDRERKRKARHSGRGIEIPRPSDVDLRRRCLDDWRTFLPTCFPGVFYQDFTPDRIGMAEAIIFAARHGGDQAVAGPRGEGKSRLALYLTLWLVLRLEKHFPTIVPKNQKAAAELLRTLKRALEKVATLAVLFPEVCVPIAELDGWASRAKKQHVNGHKTDVAWTADLIALPTIPTAVLSEVDPWWAAEGLTSSAAGQMIGCVGIEGRIRGWSERDRRPDLAILDDLDDRESAKSKTQTADREAAVDSDVAGLAGPGQRIARVMLCTIINSTCVAAKYTNPTLKPSWKGKRYRALMVEPERADLWSEYVDKRRAAMESGNDPLGRAATRFYVERRDEMDAGAVMSNPANYCTDIAEDGLLLELSALQAFYNRIADFGEEAVRTEYQNDPPVETGPETDGLTSALVRSRLTGVERRIVPRGARLVAFIDLGKYRLHWVAVAWLPGAIGFVVDYAEKRTSQPKVIGPERAIRLALEEIADEWTNPESDTYEPFLRDEDGEIVPVETCLIDSGNWNTEAYAFCRERGGPFVPSMGDSEFRQPKERTRDKIPGTERWYRSRQPGGVWVVNIDTPYWKRWTTGRLLTETFVADAEGRPTDTRTRGSLAIYGDDPKVHGDFAQQITAERFESAFVEGKGVVEKWVKIRSDNHYLDCLTGCGVAGSMIGVRLMGDGTAKPRKRISLSERQQAARGRRGRA